MKKLAIVVFLGFAAACGGTVPSDPKGGTGNAGSTGDTSGAGGMGGSGGTTGGTGGTTGTSDFLVSCNTFTAMPMSKRCVEAYAGRASADDIANIKKTFCDGSQVPPSTSPCDRTGTIGGCEQPIPLSFGAKQISWYFPPAVLDDEKKGCLAMSGGTWVNP